MTFKYNIVTRQALSGIIPDQVIKKLTEEHKKIFAVEYEATLFAVTYCSTLAAGLKNLFN